MPETPRGSPPDGQTDPLPRPSDEMMAFAASVALFLYFALVGYALAAVLHTQRDLLRNLLIAPGVGVAATLVPTYVLSRLGYPVGSFARAMAAAMLAASVGSLAWRTPPFPGRRAIPYLLIAAGAFVAAGWPLLTQGFAWLGALNPDMANYVLDAHRLVDQAFIQPIDLDVWERQSDWTAYFVRFQVYGVRPGSELLLAWTIALTGLSGHAVYMPLLVALHVAVIGSASALISTPYRLARLFSAALLACSAMLTLGVVIQLFGQVFGLLMLSLASVLCLAPFYRNPIRVQIRFVALAGLVMAAFFLAYPETLPFFGLAFLLHHAVRAWTDWPIYWRAFPTLAAIGALGCALIAPDVPGLARFLIGQATSSTTSMQLADVFPYFLIPAGIPATWGLHPYDGFGGRMLPVAIISGAVLSAGAAAGAVWLALRREPTAAITIAMLAVMPTLFAANSGFGMFKIAMYIQPFLLPTAVLTLCMALRTVR